MRCKVRARPPSVPRLGSNQSRFTDRRRVAQGCLSRSAIDDQQDFLRRPGQRPQRATNAVPAGISRRRRFVFRAPAARPSTRVPGTARRPALRRRRSPPASCPGCLQTGPPLRRSVSARAFASSGDSASQRDHVLLDDTKPHAVALQLTLLPQAIPPSAAQMKSLSCRAEYGAFMSPEVATGGNPWQMPRRPKPRK
jgi:hypothetical protein